jgi:hypothetical protein
MDQLTKEVLVKYWHVRHQSTVQPFELRSARHTRSQSVPRKRLAKAEVVAETRIDKENSILLDHLKRIIRKPLPPIRHRPTVSLNFGARVRTMLKITEENKVRLK